MTTLRTIHDAAQGFLFIALTIAVAAMADWRLFHIAPLYVVAFHIASLAAFLAITAFDKDHRQ